MRYRSTTRKHKIFYVITIVKAIVFTIVYGFLIFGGFYTGSFIISGLTDYLNTNHPLIPSDRNQEANSQGGAQNQCLLRVNSNQIETEPCF
jgi:hypothetical protein